MQITPQMLAEQAKNEHAALVRQKEILMGQLGDLTKARSLLAARFVGDDPPILAADDEEADTTHRVLDLLIKVQISPVAASLVAIGNRLLQLEGIIARQEEASNSLIVTPSLVPPNAGRFRK